MHLAVNPGVHRGTSQHGLRPRLAGREHVATVFDSSFASGESAEAKVMRMRSRELRKVGMTYVMGSMKPAEHCRLCNEVKVEGFLMRLRYSWLDLVTYPITFVLLAPLAWHLVRILLDFLGYPTMDR